MDINLKGKQAIVCGSTQGIGRAIAEELAELGASVVLIARNRQTLQEVMDGLTTKEDQTHQIIAADFMDPDGLEKNIDNFLSLGIQPEILVNNTGGPAGGPILDEPYEKFENTLTAHLRCSHILVQALTSGMKEKKYGRIINVISTSVKQPIHGLGVSNTVRGAVSSWAKTLSYELGGYGITVNNILPGFTQTGRLDYVIESISKKTGKSFTEVVADIKREIPAGRIGSPKETAALAGFLASPAASYINGTSIPVDGGRTTAI